GEGWGEGGDRKRQHIEKSGPGPGNQKKTLVHREPKKMKWWAVPTPHFRKGKGKKEKGKNGPALEFPFAFYFLPFLIPDH
ncbi:MAG: hypothetical protein WAK96_07560, partial [Desulfobaccales bacterium]